MAEEDELYHILHLSKGAVVNECVRCGAIVFHRMIHDTWHETQDRWEAAVTKLLYKIRARVVKLSDFIKGL